MIIKRIVGIDPGLDGAICTISQHNDEIDITFNKIPAIGNEPDYHALWDILVCLQDAHFFLEKVSAMPGQGVSSMFKFGRIYGALQALIAALKVPITEVRPQGWQKIMFEGIPKIVKPNGKNDPKKMARLAVKRLFPRYEELMIRAGCRTPDSGYIDALLIAEYGRRKFLN